MASVFKQRYSKNGRKCLSRKWYVEFRDENGVIHRMAGYTDKKATIQLGARLEREASQRSEGLLGPVNGYAKMSLAAHADDYSKFLCGKNNCDEHITRTRRQVQLVVEGCGWMLPRDIEAPDVIEFLSDLRSDRPVCILEPGKDWYSAAEAAAVLNIRVESVHRLIKRGKLSCEGTGRRKRICSALAALQIEQARGSRPTTSNHYLTAIKGFSRWLRQNGRSASDPLEPLTSLNVDVDLRHPRRVLEPERFLLLLAAARAGRVFRGLTGEDRFALYTVAANSGLRASELGSLFPSAFSLEGAVPTVTVKPCYSKHRKEDVQPLRRDVAHLVQKYLQGRPANLPIWPGTWKVSAAEMVRLDLGAAGIPYEVDGKIFDFHALRHQFISAVVLSTPNPKEAQMLARHSTIGMTIDWYAHTRIEEIAKVLERLPALQPPVSTTLLPDSR